MLLNSYCLNFFNLNPILLTEILIFEFAIVHEISKIFIYKVLPLV